MTPTIGRIVHYRSRTGNYTLPAIVTMTRDTAWPAGIDRGDVPELSTATSVHLHVFTPGALEQFQEHNVPMDPGHAEAGQEQLPGSWAWPPRA